MKQDATPPSKEPEASTSATQDESPSIVHNVVEQVEADSLHTERSKVLDQQLFEMADIASVTDVSALVEAIEAKVSSPNLSPLPLPSPGY